MIQLYQVSTPTEIAPLLEEVFNSGQLASGPKVLEFERQLQNYIGNEYLITTGDISSSITMALYLAGVRPGDEVIASPVACLATNMPVKTLFANLKWCDLDPYTANINVLDLEKRISEKTKAILVYHWAGYPADLAKIKMISHKYGLKVVEDAGEALGAIYNDKLIGNKTADYTAFSFYPNRHLNTIEGGALSFATPDDYEKGRYLKRYNIHQPSFRLPNGEINPQSDVREVGWNSSMNNLAATLGLRQLNALESIIKKHQENGRYYEKVLQNISGITPLKLINKASKSAYWVYTLLAKNCDHLLKKLREHGIVASRVHLRNDFYSCFGRGKQTDLPGVDLFSTEALSIPCGWWITGEEREYIANCIRNGW